MVQMPIRVLVTTWNASSAVFPELGGSVGGSETKSWSIAKALANRGDFEVTSCLRTSRPLPANVMERVHLFPVVRRMLQVGRNVSRRVQFSRQFPWVSVREFHPSLFWQVPAWSLYRLLKGRESWDEVTLEAMKTLRPDVVLSFGINQDTAAAVYAAKTLDVPIVVWLQSNGDLDSRFFTDDSYCDPNGVQSRQARLCLQQADRIICQTEWQQHRLRALVTTLNLIVPNPVDTNRYAPVGNDQVMRDHVLWIGRYDNFHKRPLLALKVAAACPEIPFLFVIHQGDQQIRTDVLEAKTQNVTIVDYLPNNVMPEAFRSARLYMSTGSKEYEGFPNVFLEAAASGTPVLSLEDFDDFLKRSQAGASAEGNLERLIELVREAWHNGERWHSYSIAGRRDVVQHYSLDAVVSQVGDVLKSCIKAQPR